MAKKKEETKQLDMGLKEPASNKLMSLKYKTRLFFAALRTNSLFTAPFIWITCTLGISFILIQNHYYTNFFDKLPKEIPVFQLARDPGLRLVDKDFLFWILIFSIILFLISTFITIKMYYRFKFISILTMTNLVLGLLLITMSYIKIFSIYIF